MRRLIILVLIPCVAQVFLLGQTQTTQRPEEWRAINGGKYFTFRLPEAMRLTSEETCVECAWGSTFSDGRVSLHATYSSWDEGYAEHYLARQSEYKKETMMIAGRRAKIQTWRWERPVRGYAYYAEAKFYSLADGKMVAEMRALCKEARDVETARRIFNTVEFLPQ